MNRKFYFNTLRPADRIVMPKSGFGLVQHHAIYLGTNNKGGRIYIENRIGKGVQIVSEAYLFRDGFEITRIERFTGNQLQRNAAVKFALQQEGKRYDLLNFNCEHFANTVQHRSNQSKQVGNGLALGLFVLALGIGLSR